MSDEGKPRLEVVIPAFVATRERFARVVAEITTVLIQNYAMSPPFEVVASAEYTAGLREVACPGAGVVRITSTLGRKMCFEVREL